MFGQDRDVAGITARLASAAETGGLLELILVVRGRVRPVQGTGRRRWRMRVEDAHGLTFSAEWVVAATPAGQRSTAHGVLGSHPNN